jgi:hypothetical protein
MPLYLKVGNIKNVQLEPLFDQKCIHNGRCSWGYYGDYPMCTQRQA